MGPSQTSHWCALLDDVPGRLFRCIVQPESDPSVSLLMDALHIQGNVLDSDFESYYSNITGFIHGDALFSNITLSSLESNESSVRWKHEAEALMNGVNTTNMSGKLGSWNWNSSAKVALSVLEKSSPGVDSLSFPSGPIVLIHVSSIFLTL